MSLTLLARPAQGQGLARLGVGVLAGLAPT